MSQALSPSAGGAYGLARTCRLFRVARSTVYLRRETSRRRRTPRSRGPRSRWDDATLLRHVREVLGESGWHGEGYRKAWARLRRRGVRVSPRRVLRVMRAAGLLAPTRVGRPHGPKAHDGTIVPDRPDVRWGTDLTSTLTGEGNASIFFVVDHATAECLGVHAARRGTRFEALEPVRQAVTARFGRFEPGIAAGIEIRHDHGSQFVSYVFQDEIAFLGLRSSPSYVREPQGNGCAERFVRTLKEELLWLQTFATIDELHEALHAFEDRYNRAWLIARHGYRTPREQYAALTGRTENAA
jgi:putative transposase